MTCGARTRGGPALAPAETDNGADRCCDHSSRSSSHLFLFFNSESRHAAANARTISDPLVSDLVRETVPARLPRRSPIRKR